MIFKKYKPTIPSKRYFTNLLFVDDLKKKKKMYTNFYKKGFAFRKFRVIYFNKKYKKQPMVVISQNVPKNIIFVAKIFSYNTHCFKEYILCKSFLNFEINMPATDAVYPGLIFNPRLVLGLNNSNLDFLNTILTIEDISDGLPVCYLKNIYNSKWTFSLSPGTFCTKIKTEIKTKLILIELPSKQQKFFFKTVLCIMGTTPQLDDPNFIKGKYGSYLKKKWKTNTRGVAMNPVDHPNGGRTKTCKPERSPWGWVAKHNK